MATITGWSPFTEAVSLRDAMDRLLEQSYLQPRRGSNGQSAQQAWRMPVDVYETPNEYVIRGWAPGVRPDDLAITWDQGALTVRGSIGGEEPDQQVIWHARELFRGEVFASIALPGPVDIDHADATFADGVLTLRVPKAEAARPKRIRLQNAG